MMEQKNLRYMPFEEVREFVRSLGLKGQKEWREYCKSGKKPDNIPSRPENAYHTDWKGYADWLGTERTQKFLPFEQAREYVHTLGIKNRREWNQFCASGKKPNDIPADPRKTYYLKWDSLGDWLGTGSVASKDREFLPFEQAREYVRAIGLNSQKDWHQFCKSKKLPHNIPTSPHTKYKNTGWKGLADWLGIENVVLKEGELLPFEQARKFVSSLNLKNYKEWQEYCISGKKPQNIPSDPWVAYEKEWGSVDNWLGIK